jgi:cytochrome c oxidase accessory protein FixG
MEQQANNTGTPKEPEIKLFAAQKKVYAKAISGRFRGLKSLILACCLGVYYLAPFLRWDRGLGVPDQAILFDIPGRRLYFFMIEIWPQEVYYLTGVLILAAVTLFFVTTLLGRVWCGYLCFQTLWTDLFMMVERLVQGDRNARMKLDENIFSFERLWKKGLTHILWLLIGLVTAGSFVLYFNDAPTLVRDILDLNVSTNVLGFIGGLTLSTYIMAGFAREQVCIYMCPYARFQSAMFDKDTLIIGYDRGRGETRGKHKAGTGWEGRGHCVDCSLCVQVCPMGIDIRNGLQMECIACGLCVDACDSVMDKVSLPRGLVRYDTEHNLELRAQGQNPHLFIIRPRTIWYTCILLAVVAAMFYALITRDPMEVHAIRDRAPLFVQMSDGTIRNGYTLNILNKTHDEKTFAVTVDGIDTPKLIIQSVGGETADGVKVAPDTVGKIRIFIEASRQKEANKDITFTVKDNATGFSDDVDSKFISRNGS